MRQSTDPYFVKLGDDAPPPNSGPHNRAPVGRDGLGASATGYKRRRRRRPRGRMVLVTLLIVGLGSWTYWASQRPGGVSGTINGWIDHTRGQVDSVSTDPDLSTARRYFNGQYAASQAYPEMSESDLAGAGIGVGVTVEWCNSQAVVIQGASGGGTVSRLMLAGHDLGEVTGKYDCPLNFANPAPWKPIKKK